MAQQVGQCGEVAQRFGHLFPVHLDHPVVDPAAGEGSSAAQRLSPFVLMVGEHQVVASAVDVESVAQQAERHGHAFDVPAGPSGPPRGVPGWLAGLGRLPEGEVQRVVLILGDVDPSPGSLPEVVKTAVYQRPVVLELVHVEVDPGVGGVGHALLHQVGHNVHHRLDVLGGPGSHIGVGDVEPVHLGDEHPLEAGR